MNIDYSTQINIKVCKNPTNWYAFQLPKGQENTKVDIISLKVETQKYIFRFHCIFKNFIHAIFKACFEVLF